MPVNIECLLQALQKKAMLQEDYLAEHTDKDKSS